MGVEVEEELRGQAGHGGHAPVGPQRSTQRPGSMLQGHQAVLTVQGLSSYYALEETLQS